MSSPRAAQPSNQTRGFQTHQCPTHPTSPRLLLRIPSLNTTPRFFTFLAATASSLSVAARKKWDAHAELRGASADAAMKGYVSLIMRIAAREFRVDQSVLFVMKPLAWAQASLSFVVFNGAFA